MIGNVRVYQNLRHMVVKNELQLPFGDRGDIGADLVYYLTTIAENSRSGKEEGTYLDPFRGSGKMLQSPIDPC